MKAETSSKLCLQAIEIRKKLGLGPSDSFDGSALPSLLKTITLIERPFGRTVCGVILKSQTDSAVIAVNSKMPDYLFHFTVAHELYHFYSSPTIQRACYTNFETPLKRDEEEENADEFARWLLLPKPVFWDYFSNQLDYRIDLPSILKICLHFNIHHSLVVKLLKEESLLPGDYVCPDDESIKRLLLEEGIESNLYEIRSDKEDEVRCEGRYIELANRLLDDEKIGESKYRELMRDIQ